jgi:hypothetical protein
MDNHPFDVVRLRDESLDWLGTERGRAFLTAYQEEKLADGGGYSGDMNIIERRKLLAADLFWVSEEMGEVCRYASATLPESILSKDDLPSVCGFVLLEKPVHFLDVNARQIGVRAFAWETGKGVGLNESSTAIDRFPSLHLTVYADTYDLDDDYSRSLAGMTQLPRLMIFHDLVWKFGRPAAGTVVGGWDNDRVLMGDGLVAFGFPAGSALKGTGDAWREIVGSPGWNEIVESLGGGCALCRADGAVSVAWLADADVHGRKASVVFSALCRPCSGDSAKFPTIPADLSVRRTFEVVDVRASMSEFVNFIVTVWTMMDQTVADVSQGLPPRHARRQAQREHRSLSPFRLVTLRRRTVDYQGDQATELEPDDQGDRVPLRRYNCRWVVRGHWREQWLPSVKRHRRQWITTYVKGKPDKPLRIGQTVVSQLVR